MNKILCVLLLFICLAVKVSAQVALSLQLPATGLVQKSQLWNMVLVYTGEGTISVHINFSLLNARDNRVLLTAATRAFTMSKGTKQITYADIAPVQYNYLSSVSNIDRSPEGFLPFGNFKACYTVFKTDNDAIIPLAEDCMQVEVLPLSPPLLNSPSDAGVIETPYPQFTWLPPAPLNLFSNLNYDLLLVEVLPGQTKEDAIQKNIPVYNTAYCTSPYNNYPASNKSLDTARTYAWKILAKNEDEFVAQSEVWTFKIKGSEKYKAGLASGSYALLQNDLEGLYVVKGDTLHVKYVSAENSKDAVYVFTDEKQKEIYKNKLFVRQGDNYLDFKTGNRFRAGKIYQLSIAGTNKKKTVLRFSISKNQ